MSRLHRTVRALFPRSEHPEPVPWEIAEAETTLRVWTVEAATRVEAMQAVDDGQADLVSSEVNVEIVSVEAVIEGES